MQNLKKKRKKKEPKKDNSKKKGGEKKKKKTTNFMTQYRKIATSHFADYVKEFLLKLKIEVTKIEAGLVFRHVLKLYESENCKNEFISVDRYGNKKKAEFLKGFLAEVNERGKNKKYTLTQTTTDESKVDTMLPMFKEILVKYGKELFGRIEKIENIYSKESIVLSGYKKHKLLRDVRDTSGKGKKDSTLGDVSEILNKLMKDKEAGNLVMNTELVKLLDVVKKDKEGTNQSKKGKKSKKGEVDFATFEVHVPEFSLESCNVGASTVSGMDSEGVSYYSFCELEKLGSNLLADPLENSHGDKLKKMKGDVKEIERAEENLDAETKKVIKKLEDHKKHLESEIKRKYEEQLKNVRERKEKISKNFQEVKKAYSYGIGYIGKEAFETEWKRLHKLKSITIQSKKRKSAFLWKFV